MSRRFIKIISILLLLPGYMLAQYDTTWAASGAPVPRLKRQHAYHQTLVLKLFLSQAGFDGPFKRKDNGQCTISLNFEQALQVIKKLDELTVHIPKIIYLVGWQYNGHDSKYPAFFEGNERLKRPGDKNALESLRWLMREAKKYHTTVSLHINMFDAYEDSPLWDTYVQHDIIAKNIDGSLLGGEWGYPISYAQEWQTGFTKKRIDSLCRLLPVQDAGTIHIDAFHTWPPLPVSDATGKHSVNLDKKPTSPFLPFTTADETAAQVNIFKYWASKAVDVTSEGVDFLRETDFAGLQPMAWWYNRNLEYYLKYPADYYTGGVDNGEWGKLFGSSMHGEQEIKNDPDSLTGFLEKFCLNTIPWYYLNRLQRLYVVQGNQFKKAIFANQVSSGLQNGHYRLEQNGQLLSDGENMCMPALWLQEPALIAYSKPGYRNQRWFLPEQLRSFDNFEVYSINLNGNRKLLNVKNDNGSIVLSMPPSTGYLILPVK